MTENLLEKRCVPCEGGVPVLEKDKVDELLKDLDDWKLATHNNEIFKVFNFKNYYQTMAFVNAVAWMAHQEDHHPDLEVSYNHCTVRYSTHAIGGLSENDFICASKVERIVENPVR